MHDFLVWWRGNFILHIIGVCLKSSSIMCPEFRSRICSRFYQWCFNIGCCWWGYPTKGVATSVNWQGRSRMCTTFNLYCCLWPVWCPGWWCCCWCWWWSRLCPISLWPRLWITRWWRLLFAFISFWCSFDLLQKKCNTKYFKILEFFDWIQWTRVLEYSNYPCRKKGPAGVSRGGAPTMWPIPSCMWYVRTWTDTSDSNIW